MERQAFITSYQNTAFTRGQQEDPIRNKSQHNNKKKDDRCCLTKLSKWMLNHKTLTVVGVLSFIGVAAGGAGVVVVVNTAGAVALANRNTTISTPLSIFQSQNEPEKSINP